ncbi:MAG: hypothetical protein JXA98_05625 [Methanosarcinaceae archaeon]|nr:hypothetical protein [Methanosarcinaceae archaeon]
MQVAIADDAVPVVKESIQKEVLLLESKINLVEREIKGFEEKHHLKSSEFMEKFESGELGDSQNFFEWWGLLTGLKKLEDKLKKARAVITYW